jgi:hypothetical protein
MTELETAVSVIRVPDQILSMDEPGFCPRPVKAKKNGILSLNKCTTKPAFRKEIDIRHVWLVPTNNLLRQRFKPLYLITNKAAIKDPELQMMSNSFALRQTKKGHQNARSMEFYVREILGPYCENLRNVTPDQTLLIFLMMDNCSSHNKQEFAALYARYKI